MEKSSYKWTLFRPYVPNRKALLWELNDTLDSRWLGQGPKVDQFEQEWDAYFGATRAVTVSSGTAALQIAYRVVGIEPGDTVLTPVFTCTATNHALRLLGADLVFLDIDPKTLSTSSIDVRKKAEKYNAKAIVAVHVGGIPADILGINLLGGLLGAEVVYDAAQAVGARYADQYIGAGASVGSATAFSLQSIKTLTTADGGVITFPEDCPERVLRARRLRWFGIDRDRHRKGGWKPWNGRKITGDQVEPGYKYQMNDVAACFGLTGLRALGNTLNQRRRLAAVYRRQFKNMGGIELLEYDRPSDSQWPSYQSGFSMFGLLVEERESFSRALAEHGVETNVVQVRNDLYSVFGGERKKDLPVMDELENRYVFLPLHNHLSIADVEEISEIVRKGW